MLAGSAAEFERSVPFSVWADALDAYVAAQQLELADRRRPRRDPAVAAPRRARPPARSPTSATARTARCATCSTCSPTTGRSCSRLDDLHWSDPASIDLIAALAAARSRRPRCCSCSPSAPARRRALLAALAAPAVERIALAPLTRCRRGAARRLRDASAIYRRAGGNPFYLEQLARFAPHGGGSVDADADDGSGIPAAVAASLAEELAGLSGDERALLEGAAVAGEPFEPDLAAVIGELSLEAGLDALDALLARDLLRPTTVPRRFRFRHPLVRRAVYDAARGGWRLGAHARAADALAGRGAATSELAHHVERSAAQGDEAAIAILHAAGTETAPRAPAAAARWFQAALRLLPAAAVERRIDLLVALASAQRSLELETCRGTLLAAMELLPADADARARRVELTAHCAAVEHWLGRHEDAHRRLVRAWEDLPDRTSAAAAALQIELAVDGLYVLDFAQSLEMGRGALAVRPDDR